MSSNRILSRLSRDDFALLEPYLEAVDLPVRKQLEARGKRIDQVYFMESGFASVVANGKGASIEVGIIGRDGMTGLPLLLGHDRAQHETFIQLAGTGMRISAANLRRADEASITLHRTMLRYVHAFMQQTTTTALANGRSKTEARLARWLLMAHDRVDGDVLHLTHEFLGMMLATHRPGVTIAVQALERAGFISARRASITILKRKALEKYSNGAYVPPNGD
jgi:CRP-like cAMP-binding protein